MTDAATLRRHFVHAVLWPDGTIQGPSIAAIYPDGTFTIEPYRSETAGVSHTNAIAVIAPEAMGATLRAIAASAATIPALIDAVEREQRPAEAARCHILTPAAIR